ncbi:MAG: hypothetical protein BYD32DRAFT_13987 [Podila humilis]|nr:MAG: hypothetical protein BYD32DRAFT_13987 [Podila humilis]
MACNTFKGSVVPAPLVGEPSVMNFTLMGKLCIMHANGLMTQCVFTEYKQGCCCGTDKIGFEVPILGYNTTPTVYMTCEGGLVPEINPTSTKTYTGLYPPSKPTGSYPFPSSDVPEPTPSTASKNKIGMVFLLTMLVAMI